MSEEFNSRRDDAVRRETERRADERGRFRELKTQHSYYLVSVPFAVMAVAVASFPFANSVPTSVVVTELVSWALLLVSGWSGLWARYGEIDQARLNSVSAAGQIAAWSAARDPSDVFTKESAELSQRLQARLTSAEKAEAIGGKWHIRLLGLGITLWAVARAMIVVAATH